MDPSSWDATLDSSHLSSISVMSKQCAQVMNTEITNKECLRSIRRPFPIGNIVFLVHVESKLLGSLLGSVVEIGWHDVDELC
jgi:hypothetical protein